MKPSGRPANRIAAIVLAAGRSRRFNGANKLLADLGGHGILARTLDLVARAGLGDVVVVTGHEREAVEAVAAAAGIRTVHNPDYRQGMGSSIAVGAGALGAEAEAAFICLADMPRILPATFGKLIAALPPPGGGSSQRIAVPVRSGKRGHPVLFGSEVFPELMSLTGDKGARTVCEARPGREIRIEVDDPGIHLDIDTPADLETGQGARKHR